MSQETKDKLRKINTGRICSEETKQKISKANTGRKYGIEVREKVSKNHSRWNAGLSDSDVHDICKMYLSGLTSREIYKTYPNVHYCTLSEIRRKKTYKHITCLYDIPKPQKFGDKTTHRIVLCVEDDLQFNGLIDAATYYGVAFQNISESALKNRKIRKINKTFKYE
jgi:hypothetical protein